MTCDYITGNTWADLQTPGDDYDCTYDDLLMTQWIVATWLDLRIPELIYEYLVMTFCTCDEFGRTQRACDDSWMTLSTCNDLRMTKDDLSEYLDWLTDNWKHLWELVSEMDDLLMTLWWPVMIWGWLKMTYGWIWIQVMPCGWVKGLEITDGWVSVNLMTYGWLEDDLSTPDDLGMTKDDPWVT